LATILFVTPRFPWPLTKGDQLRAFNQIKYLASKHRIILFAITDENIQREWLEELSKYCIHVEVFKLSMLNLATASFRRITSDLPVQSIYHYHTSALSRLKQLYGRTKPDKLIFQLIRTAPYAAHFPKHKCIIDLMDCFSYHYLLRSRNTGFRSSWFYKMEYKRLKRYEETILSTYSLITVISKKDKELLPGKTDHVSVVPNGVEAPRESLSDEKFDLIFLGNLSYQPNIAAAKFICNEILPLVKRWKKVTVAIAGKTPSNQVRALNSEDVYVIPDLPEIFPVLQSAQIFVAPMFLSTGVQNKLLEAMAAGLIVITTPNAADAIGAVPGMHLLTAVSADQFAQLIVEVLEDSRKYDQMRETARRFMETNFNWKASIDALEKLVYVY
jgi:polysaccharide biosynthesis protein PslH